jgi:ribosome-associated toxin RatA of RatAB toxin-antitoxin module
MKTMSPNAPTRNLRKLSLRAAMVAACAVLSCGAGKAANLNPISLAFYDQWGHFKVEGSFFVNADPTVAWKVLTDYDHIPHFVHSMKVSEASQRDGNDLVLKQEGEGGFLFFTQQINLLLNVHEVPQKSIIFEDTSHKDFDFYQGTWTINPASSSSLEIIYTLDAQEHFGAPAFLVGDSIQGSVKDLLQSVQKEMTAEQLLADQKKSSQNFLVRNPQNRKD